MIQGNFHRVKGAEAVRSSGYHSDFVVQALDDAAGDFAFGPKPVQQQLLMRAQHPRHFLHRLEAAAQGAPSPIVQKVAGVPDRFIGPEVFKEVFERRSPPCQSRANRCFRRQASSAIAGPGKNHGGGVESQKAVAIVFRGTRQELW